MNKLKCGVCTALIAVGSCFGSFLILLILSFIIWSGENAVLPGWYAIILIFLPIAIGVSSAYRFHRKHASKQSTSDNSVKVAKPQPEPVAVRRNPNVPSSKKAQEETAKKILTEARADLALAKKSETVTSFIALYDRARGSVSKLLDFDKLSDRSEIPLKCEKLDANFQLHLCNAIVRAKDIIISEIKGRLKNSREYQQQTVAVFENDIISVRDRFSAGTLDVAFESISELRKLVGLDIPYDLQISIRGNASVVHAECGADLTVIDEMEGHQFEYWCANALEHCGFTNVEVTPGSGDQGVDVLAYKDGIKYAVQCKRYTSDLGNTPVQEVHSGKTFYHCHVGVVMTNRYFTNGAKRLAKETGVLLWDRDWIIEYLKQHCDSLQAE